MFRLLSTSAAALIVAAAPVLAEVTPVQVWDSIVAMERKFGYEVTEGGREEAGDTLTVTDVRLTVDMVDPSAAPAADAAAGTDGGTDAAPAPSADAAAKRGVSSFEMVIPKVVLQQTGDGNVKTVFEGDVTGNVTPAPGEDAPQQIGLTLSMPGNEMISSGTPEALSHALTYPTLTATLDIKDAKGGTMPVAITLTDTKGSYQTNANSDTTYALDSAEMTVTSDITAPADAEAGKGGGTGKVNFKMSNLKSTGDMKAPQGTFDMATQMNAALQAGLAMQGAMTFGAYTGDIEFAGKDAEGKDQNGKATVEGEGGDLTFAMGKDGLSYKGSSKGAKVDFTSSDVPFPIAYGVASGSAEVTMPVMKSDTPQPFRFAYDVKGLTLGDGIWGLFDPTAQLPRDPADLTVDVTGDVKVKRDLFDPEMAAKIAAASTPAEGADGLSDEQMAELEKLHAEAMPFEPQKITITRVALNAVGASADLSGELTVPEGGSIESPVGKINGNFTGVNGLIDRLVKLGFVPQDQVAGFKMMLAAFARPVEGQPDALTTELEFKADGTVFANGQQVK